MTARSTFAARAALICALGAVVQFGLSLPTRGAARQGDPQASLPPAFRPGLYEAVSRNSRAQDQTIRSRLCIAAENYAAFRREARARYERPDNGGEDCRLKEESALADGFVFNVKCAGDQILLSYRFSEDLVSGLQENVLDGRPEAFSQIRTLMRRIGDCPKGQSAEEKIL